MNVQHEPYLAQRIDGGFEQQLHILQLAPLPVVLPRLLLTMSWVFDSITVSTILSLLARSEEPVSVTSTMASASTGGFTSVAPQLNSTLALTPLAARYRFVVATSSVAMILPCRSFTD